MWLAFWKSLQQFSNKALKNIASWELGIVPIFINKLLNYCTSSDGMIFLFFCCCCSLFVVFWSDLVENGSVSKLFGRLDACVFTGNDFIHDFLPNSMYNLISMYVPAIVCFFPYSIVPMLWYWVGIMYTRREQVGPMRQRFVEPFVPNDKICWPWCYPKVCPVNQENLRSYWKRWRT